MAFFSSTFPATFRSPLDPHGGSLAGLHVRTSATEVAPAEANLRARCQCGDCDFAVTVRGHDGSPPALIRCHCAACRKFHTSAFGAFVPLAHEDGEALLRQAKRFEHSCVACGGAVERLFCGRCLSTLATLPLEGRRAGEVLLALGCVEDASIPSALALHWQEVFEERQPAEVAAWWTAVPKPTDAAGVPHYSELRGSCACGRCAFVAESGTEFQTQHCYCNLCRRLSGSVAMTWVPVMRESFRWTTQSDSLELRRTTGHGQRHMCSHCGGVLTIVYDSQPDCIWPVAGALEDDSLPKDVGAGLCRAIHICCSMMQPWYRLPMDGLPRLRYAG